MKKEWMSQYRLERELVLVKITHKGVFFALWLQYVLRHLNVWARNWRTRRALSTLTSAQLEDIGLTAEDAIRECKKWCWQTKRCHIKYKDPP